MTDPSPPRRPFQFRLRTLMVAVTMLAVSCAYLGWQAKIVRERKAMVEHLLNVEDAYIARDGSNAPIDHNKMLPWIRRLFGDEAIIEVGVPVASRMTAREIHGVLPEAVVNTYIVNPTTHRRTIVPKAD
jgi:hypothetical protein